jgi:hypothetical protein
MFIFVTPKRMKMDFDEVYMQKAALALIFCVTGLNFGCTASVSTDEAASTAGTPEIGTLQLEAIDKVIAITDPVVAFAATDTSSSAAAAISFNQLNIGSLFMNASQGVSLGASTDTIKSRFSQANGSKAFCDTVNNAMKFFKEASQADFNLCILKKATQDLTLREGDFQTWDFKAKVSEGTYTFRMKFALATETDGQLKSFESFTCKAMGSSAMTQSGYSSQTVTNGKLAIHARVDSDEGLVPVKIRTDVTGELNAEGRPVGLKSIDYAELSDDRSVRSKVIQSDSNIQAIGYEKASGRYVHSISFVELLDQNASTGQYAITKLAYGDGAALTRTVETSGAQSDNTSSWNGDTLVLNSAEPRRAKVTGRTSEFLATTDDDLAVDFTSSETYDCAGAADETISLTENDVASCMEAFEIDQNGSTMCNGLSY